MPRNDGTGPRGEGPMTGGGFGTCATDDPARIEEARGGLLGLGRGGAPRHQGRWAAGRGRFFGGRGGGRFGFGGRGWR